MNDEQTSTLWAFARGDCDPQVFETWFFAQADLETELGEELYFNLLSANYGDERDAVPNLRRRLVELLEPSCQCECPKIRDMSAVPMGGDFYFERVFASLVTEIEYGKDKWWLYISKCSVCQTYWLVAQDDRIYDDFFMKRISGDEAQTAKSGLWPKTFATYESVLELGRKVSTPPMFFEKFAASLIWTVQDLNAERSQITSEEVAYLLGISNTHADKLISKAEQTAK